jgi:uncharacterized Zn ribbon protein
MKQYYDGIFIFLCNECGKQLSQNDNEQEALRIARLIAEKQRWEWFHPGWGLYCPECSKKYKDYRQ